MVIEDPHTTSERIKQSNFSFDVFQVIHILAIMSSAARWRHPNATDKMQEQQPGDHRECRRLHLAFGRYVLVEP